MVYGETYTWEGDKFNVYTKFVENIVIGAEKARTKEIVDHFECDLSDFREFLESKQKQPMNAPDLAFKPPIKAIRVKSCGNDWVTDIDATLTADQIRGLSLDSDGVHIYSKERDIHGAYDNIFVPYSNLEALVFYFNEPPKDCEINMSCPYCHEDRDGYVIPIEKNCHAYIVFPDTLRLKFDRQARECKINYCPMCGRKLSW